MSEYKHKELTIEIINAAHTVHNRLRYDFLEKIYHDSLFMEFKKRCHRVEFEKPVEVRYDNQVVEEFLPTFLLKTK